MIDFYNDAAHAYLRNLLEKYPGTHGLLKNAEFEDTRDEISHSAFADLSAQRFPTHTPEHAVLSFLYANDQQAPSGVMHKIAEALYAYGIDSSIFVPQETTKTASASRSLFDDGSYPVNTPEQVKMAEARLFEEVHKIGLTARAQVFNKLAHVAEDIGVELSPRAQAWGMSAYCNPEELARAVEARGALCKTAELKDAYYGLAQSIHEDPHAVREYAVRVKVAETLEAMDRQSGLDAYYERAIPDPLCSVFNRPAKLGEQLMHLGPNTYEANRILGLPLSFFRDTLGPEIVSEIAPGGVLDPESLMAILPTLPADILVPLEQGLHSAGVQPTGL